MAPVEIRLEAGELRNVEILLDAQLPPGAPYRAELIEVAKQEELRVGFVTPGVPVRDLRPSADFAPGHRLLLRILAERCCREGSYEYAILVRPSPAGKVARPVRVPVRVWVAEATGPLDCRGRVRRAVSRSAIAGVAALYLFGWFANSQFLSRRELALRLRPLRWDGVRGPVEHSAQDVERLVRRDLSFRKRAFAWLAANPLVFGFPGGSYHETVELQLQPKLDVYASRLALRGERNLPLKLQETPDLSTGLFATAIGGLRFFAVAVRGRVGAFSLDGLGTAATSEPLFSWLSGSRTLLYRRETETRDAPIGPAGWRI